MNFPSSGFGQQSQYYDDEILLDGSYQIISATVHSTSRDDENSIDTAILRKGLLLTKSQDYSGFYVPLDTASGKLNGNSPTQFMNDVVVLGRKTFIDKDFILGQTRQRSITARHRAVAAYLSCNIYSNKVYYNNKSNLAITDEQWEECQRIVMVSPEISLFEETDNYVRALLWRRKETFVSPGSLYTD